VRLGSRVVGVTDRNGKFAVRAVPTNDRVAVTFSAPTFMSTTRIYDAAAVSTRNTVVIWPRATPARLRTSEGGKLEFSGGTIEFPPDAFVDTKGRRVTGDVNVSMSVLDITDQRQLASAPGDFTARMRDGSIRNLETFGLFELVIADAYGQRVELARGRTARVDLNVPKGRPEVPQSVGSFSFDQQSGRWMERTSTWQRQVSTLSTQLQQDGTSGWWNVDKPLSETTCMRVEVRGCKQCNNNTIVTTATVKAHGKDYSGAITQGNTINNGVACLFVKKSAQVILEVIDAQTAYSVEVDTPPNVLNVCDATCPLVVTHAVGAPLNANTQLNSGWCATDGANASPFNTEFSSANTSATASNVTLTIAPCTSNCTKGYISGEYKTDCFHGYGTYKATIDPPQKPTTGSIEGLVTGFFTFTDGSDGTTGPGIANWHDEVDIELVGRDPHAGDYLPGAPNPGGCLSLTNPMVVHTNYFTKKPWQLANQRDYCIPYGTHNYEFDWTATQIEWRYDGIVLRKVMRTNDDWPTQPGRLYLNLWGTDGTLDGSFAGANAYNLAQSRTAIFSNISTP